MKVNQCMTSQVKLISPNASMREAAEMMAKNDFGFLPVSDGNRLIGVLTDRDIAVRGVARGQDPESTMVRDVMSKGVLFCYDDQAISDIAQNMAEVQVKRLPVLNRDKMLVGIISLSDVARSDEKESARALTGISRKQHNEERARRHAQQKEAS